MFFDTIEATRRGQIFRRLGSFWNRMYSVPKHIRIFLAAFRQTKSLVTLESVINNLAGNHDAGQIVSQVFVGFKAADIFETGAQYYDDPNQFYAGIGEPASAYDIYRIKYYGLLLQRILPISIQSSKRKLVLGIDFFVQVNKLILFREDPRILFPDGRYLVTLGIDRDYQPIHNFLTGSISTDNLNRVVDYFRVAQTPETFKLALAAEAGLKILSSQQRLLVIYQHARDVEYEFEEETLRVDYFHDLLKIGQVYPKNYIIGEGIQVFQNQAGDWWRQVDWRGGFSLDPFIGLRGLSALDKETIAYSAGSDDGSIAGSKLHARVKLFDDGSADAETQRQNFILEKAYWENVGFKETEAQRFLNALVGLPEDTDSGDLTRPDTYAKLIALNTQANEINAIMQQPLEAPDVRALSNTKLVNALDIFFRSVLGTRGFVILVDQMRIKNQEQMAKFLIQEMPIGCTPIIFGYAPQIPIESGRINDNIGADEHVVVQNVTPVMVSSGANMNTPGSTFVHITQEAPLI